MTKYDFMFIEDLADQMGTLYLQDEKEELLGLTNDLITIANQIKSDLLREIK